MDHPDFGRKKSTYIGFGMVAVCSVGLMILGEGSISVMLVMFLIIKIFITTTFMVNFLTHVDALPILS